LLLFLFLPNCKLLLLLYGKLLEVRFPQQIFGKQISFSKCIFCFAPLPVITQVPCICQQNNPLAMWSWWQINFVYRICTVLVWSVSSKSYGISWCTYAGKGFNCPFSLNIRKCQNQDREMHCKTTMDFSLWISGIMYQLFCIIQEHWLPVWVSVPCTYTGFQYIR
jgi:hypothetical protein